MAKRTQSKRSSGGVWCLRISLVMFNFAAMLGGVAMLGCGVWLFYQCPNVAQYNQQQLNRSIVHSDIYVRNSGSPNMKLPSQGEFFFTSIFLISLGSVVTLISFFGVAGACVKSRCLLLCYLSFLVLILCFQILVVLVGVGYREPIGKSIQKELLGAIKNYQPSNLTSKPWDHLHREFRCCGLRDYRDWYGINAWPGKNYVPDSCCLSIVENKQGCGRMSSPSLIYQDGCLERVHRWVFYEKLHVIGSVVATILFVQLYGLIASTILFAYLKSPPKNNSKLYKTYPYERAGIM